MAGIIVILNPWLRLRRKILQGRPLNLLIRARSRRSAAAEAFHTKLSVRETYVHQAFT
jgi:hypothetical protein